MMATKMTREPRDLSCHIYKVWSKHFFTHNTDFLQEYNLTCQDDARESYRVNFGAELNEDLDLVPLQRLQILG